MKKKVSKKPATKKVIKPVVEPKKVVPATPLDKAIALYEGSEYQEALKRLEALRKEGEWKILRIKDENINIKINKQLNKEGKEKLLNLNKGEMAVAKGIAEQNKEMIKNIVNRIAEKSKVEFAPIFEEAVTKMKSTIAKANEDYKVAMAKAKEEYNSDLERIESKFADKKNKERKVEIEAAKISYSSKVNAAKSAHFSSIDKAKEEKYLTYQASYEYLSKLRLNKHTEGENIKYGFETYIRSFNLVNWLTKNALILIVLAFFFVLLCVSGGKILAPDFVLTSLSQIAPKIFFALGVAGLILLGGTDLSIGRLTAVGASFTLMILTSDPNNLSWFKFMKDASLGGKVIVALLFSVLICTIFTTISGFFTAKFKMHPFISTLAVQLIVYGFFQAFFSSVAAFTIDDTTQKILGGSNGWLLVLYAAIAIVVVWFIWNKTKFGKNLYAVGGNPEAAAVSGINPIKITILAFVMAGVLYGLGGFVQAIQGGSANFNSYNGTETDAIAACVIGGVSFSGGVGTIGGVVGGTIILGFLTSCFSFLELDANIQFVIKGVIILTAVTLDCIKYIRKK